MSEVRPFLKLRDQKFQEKQEAKQTKNHQIEVCDECKKSELVIKHVEGTIVCQNCGLVQQSRIIDDSSEWRTFNSENSPGSSHSNPSRVGGKLNPYLHNSGIDTVVKGKGAAEIQKWNERTAQTQKDKQKQQGFHMIRDIQNRLNLKVRTWKILKLQEPTINKAMHLYSQIEDNGQLKGKNTRAKVAAVLFIASRQTNFPKSIKNILETTGATQKELSSCYKKIKEIIPEAKVQTQAFQIAEQACNRLGLPMDVSNAA